MNVWQRRFLFVFFFLGLILIGRQSPVGTGEQLNKTEFAEVAQPAPPEPVSDVTEAAIPLPPVEPEAPLPVKEKKVSKPNAEKPQRTIVAEEKPVYPGNYKRVSIDMTNYVPPEPRPSRYIASVDKQLTSAKGSYALADALAVEADKFDVSMGEQIEEKAGFIVFKPVNKSAGSFSVDDRTRPVVVNRSSGAIGIVTGTIVVRLKDFEQAEALGTAFGLEEVSSDDTIDTVFYKAPNGREIDDLIELLRADGRVNRADAEIIQSTRQIH